ncbi:MAG: M20/M25/M40 family metallo-hydrolase, partial [Clostridia bacterium]|nr:M20/M25/M40 family metallo-hydrolase [Clostridia bacterium]
SLLSAKRLINIDSEEEDTVTVSCAGGSDLELFFPIKPEKKKGTLVEIKIGGLQGGHSGIEIGKGRVNADILMGRVLSTLSEEFEICFVSVSGGNKGNAIPLASSFEGLVADGAAFGKRCEEVLLSIQKEFAIREPGFTYEVKIFSEEERAAVGFVDSKRFFDFLFALPDGVVTMSPSIPNLVETSLNLGILKTNQDHIFLKCMLRSNIYSAMLALESRVAAFARLSGAQVRSYGHYPPWEFKPESKLRDLYARLYREETGKEIRVEAIHAGLECGVISAGLPELDCISIGPDLFDVHTTKEKLSLPSVKRVYYRLIKMLKEMA